METLIIKTALNIGKFLNNTNIENDITFTIREVKRSDLTYIDPKDYEIIDTEFGSNLGQMFLIS